MIGPSNFLVVLPDEIYVIFVALVPLGISRALIATMVTLEILDSEGDEMIQHWTNELKGKGLNSN